jgi:carbonic anhydrase
MAGFLAIAAANALGASEAAGPDDAFRQLSTGNARYVTGQAEHPRQDEKRRIRTAAEGQKPTATVIAAADARVPVEMIFDQGVGDLYVIRVAGLVPDTTLLASVDYGVNHLKSPLLVVMGHSDCDLVEAVLDGSKPGGRFGRLTEKIQPIVDRAKRAFPQAEGEELLQNCIKANVQNTIETILTECPEVSKAAQQRKIKVLGAFYDLDTGKVYWLPGPGARGATRSKAPDGSALQPLSNAVPPENRPTRHDARPGTTTG